MYRRILVPHDGSAFAEQVLPHAVEIAKLCGAELHLLEVIEPPNPALLNNELDSGVSAQITMETLEEAEEATREQGESRLSVLTNRLKDEGLTVKWKVVEGDPARTIIDYEREYDIDLVAMASHGRTGLVRTILGSVTDTVLREGGRPVLIIRPRES